MLITRPEESCRPWCVVVCDLENLKNEEAMTRVGSQRHSKKKEIHEIGHDHLHIHSVSFIHCSAIGCYVV